MTDHWIPCGQSITGSERTIYDVSTQAADERVDLGHDAVLLIQISDTFWVRFAVLEWHYTGDEGPRHTMLFHGEGTAAPNLRECRHVWWGEDGYTFHPPFDVVETALRHLRRWFDGN